MFKMVGIEGAAKGITIALKVGTLTIGRAPDNNLVLNTPKVSKHHCKITTDATSIQIQDLQSSHGTFVNGALISERMLTIHDQIQIADCMFQLRPLLEEKALVPFSGDNKSILLTQMLNNESQNPDAHNETAKNLKGLDRAKFLILQQILKLNRRWEWNTMALAGLSIYVLISLIFIVDPILESSEGLLQRESMNRAIFFAQTLALQASANALQNNINKIDTALIENSKSVITSVIVDLDLRILAPAHRATGYLESNPEAQIAIAAKGKFQHGLETGFCLRADQNTITAIEPVKVFYPAQGKNVVIGMAVVSLDFSLAKLTPLQSFMVYCEAGIVLLALGVLFLWLGYQPLISKLALLKDDIEKCLRQDAQSVTNVGLFMEFNEAIDIINSLITRIKTDPLATTQTLTSEALVASMQNLSEWFNTLQPEPVGLVILNEANLITFANFKFEEITAIRADQAIGQDLFAVSRDESFSAMMKEILSQLPYQTQLQEDFEFSGNAYLIKAYHCQLTQAQCSIITFIGKTA
jgi:hypothetical protein